MPETGKGRLAWVDAARGIGILCIVLGHVLGEGVFRDWLYSFHVPLFVFVSGCVYGSGKRSVASYFQSSALSLLLPYIVFAALSVGIFTVVSEFGFIAEESKGFFQSLGGFLYGNAKTGLMRANLPLWFLPCLFVIRTFFYPVDRYSREISRPGRAGAIAVAGLSLCLLGYLNTYHYKLFVLPFGAETALNLSIFFALGMLAGMKKDLADKLLRGSTAKAKRFAAAGGIAAAGAGLIVLGAYLSRLNGFVNYFRDLYGDNAKAEPLKSYLLFLGSAVAGIAGWCLLSMLVANFKPLAYVGRRTMPILLMHKLPIEFFELLFVRFALENRLLTAAQAAAAAASIALCLLAAKVLEKKCWFLIGYSRPVKEAEKHRHIDR